MANGFQYESPLNRLLGITIPKFVEGQLEREHKERISDREFTYREEQNILNRQREDESLKLATKRYDDSIIEAEDDERYRRSASIFEDTSNLYPNIARQFKAFEAIDISKLHPDVATRVESQMAGLKERIADVTSTMAQYSNIKVYSELDNRRIQSAFMEGKDGDAVADDILRNKFSTPYIKVQASNIGQKLGILYKDISEAQEVLLVTTDDKQRKKIQSTIDNIQGKINIEDRNKTK